jgi:hypothetical protein
LKDWNSDLSGEWMGAHKNSLFERTRPISRFSPQTHLVSSRQDQDNTSQQVTSSP